MLFKQKHYIHPFEYKIEFYIIMLKRTLFFGLLNFYLLSVLRVSLVLPGLSRVKHSPWKLRRKFSSLIYIYTHTGAWFGSDTRRCDKNSVFPNASPFGENRTCLPADACASSAISVVVRSSLANVSCAISRERCYSAEKRCQPNVPRLKSDKPIVLFARLLSYATRERFR